MQRKSFLSTAVCAMIGLIACGMLLAGSGPNMAMKPDFMKTATYRWLQKPVLQSRLLDSMEDLSTWKLENLQAPGVIELSSDPVFEPPITIEGDCRVCATLSV